MAERPEKDSASSRPATDKEVRYMAEKMGVSTEEMRSILDDSSAPPKQNGNLIKDT